MPGIIIVSNNRAEWGPLQSVAAALPESQVLGLTELQQRGPPAQVMSFGLWWFDREFAEREPDLVLVVGDRYETLSAVQAAYFRGIPVAHIHGGETTAGAFDDAIRDAITRMSALHFVATEDARNRVEDLNDSFLCDRYGVLTTNIHLTGAPGLDGVPGNSARRGRKLILVTYHPETRKPDYGVAACREMLSALPLGYEVVFCGVNNDPGCDQIRALIDEWVRTHGGRLEPSLTHAEYIALMQEAALVVGNSSAGVIEAPWVGVPTVLVGDRQLGREYATSVFQDDSDISAAIRAALAWHSPWQPCYRGEAAPRIAKIVREFVSGRARPSP